ncbi:MAG: DUF1150 family protein [Alphaproteobacteria bacterium]
MTMMINGIDPRQMTVDQFAAFGMSDIAYVKPVVVDGRTAYAIHAADGRPVAVMEDRDVALAAIRQNNLEPMGIH